MLTTLAWHFVGDTLRDGRPVPPDGVWLEHEGSIVICASGLHASRDVWDALSFAPGAVLCRVEVEGIAKEQTDKLVARRRRILQRVDMTTHLRAFAREEARRVLHLWDAPDIVRQYLETGDEDIRLAARDAARLAARVAARDAARDAAVAAAWAAAWDAALLAAWDASAAASAAARAAAWDASASRFRAIVRAQFGGESC